MPRLRSAGTKKGPLFAGRLVGAMKHGSLTQWGAPVAHEDFRVDRSAAAAVVVDVHFEVQVRSGGVAGGADQTDGFAGRDGLPDGDGGMGLHVAVAGDDAAAVLDFDVPTASLDGGGTVAVAAVITAIGRDGLAGDNGDRVGGRGNDGGPGGGGDVDALVGGPLRGAEPGHDRAVHGLGPGPGGAARGQRGLGKAADLRCRFRELMSSPERGAVSVPGDSSNGRVTRS